MVDNALVKCTLSTLSQAVLNTWASTPLGTRQYNLRMPLTQRDVFFSTSTIKLFTGEGMFGAGDWTFAGQIDFLHVCRWRKCICC